MAEQERLRDAAYAGNIDPATWDHAVAGYYGGPQAFHVWSPGDWARFAGHKKLPIWVAGLNGAEEGAAAVAALKALRVPRGVWTVVDMEARADRTYVEAFGQALHAARYKVWVYGSAATVFGNPALDGYWVADYAGRGPFMYSPPAGQEVRATQYASGTMYDSSAVKDFTFHERTRWWI